MVKKFIFIVSMTFILNGLSAQDSYELVFKIYQDALEGNVKISFKEAVFHCENAYFGHQLRFEDFNGEIGLLSIYSRILKNIDALKYDKKDKERISTYAAIFLLMTDTVNIELDSGKVIQHLPYYYDFDDIFGSQDWTQTFVTKLLESRTGNCHSMPYLYKILCEEIEVPCHLALAPNHIYIKHWAEKGGWYNTELTSASFPIDAWLMASGYISLQAVQNGIYLDTLSDKESLALCVLDLAQGYNYKYPDNDGSFAIECCDLAIKYFPNYVNAILLKAEMLLKQLHVMQKEMKYTHLKQLISLPQGKIKWDEMNNLYMQLYNLGYRQIPEQMYIEWLTSLKMQKERYSNNNTPK
jgi:hypothetical protein